MGGTGRLTEETGPEVACLKIGTATGAQPRTIPVATHTIGWEKKIPERVEKVGVRGGIQGVNPVKNDPG